MRELARRRVDVQIHQKAGETREGYKRRHRFCGRYGKVRGGRAGFLGCLEILSIFEQLNFTAGAALFSRVTVAGCAARRRLLARKLTEAVERTQYEQSRRQREQNWIARLQIIE